MTYVVCTLITNKTTRLLNGYCVHFKKEAVPEAFSVLLKTV